MLQEKRRKRLSGQTVDDMSEDPRAAHTKRVLQEALMGLLRRGDWGEITVAGICRRAGVARSSFYEHYNTKSELLDQIFADMMTNISLSARPNEPLGTLNWLADHVAEGPEFFANAMRGGRSDTLLPRFRSTLIRRLSDELNARGISDAHLKAAYIIGGSMAYLAANSNGADRAFIHEMAALLTS